MTDAMGDFFASETDKEEEAEAGSDTNLTEESDRPSTGEGMPDTPSLATPPD